MSAPERIGRYEIEAEIGHGSMGVVYRARDPRIGRVVALKCVSFSFPLPSGEEDDFLARFYHEAQIAGSLSHPNIVTIHDVGTKETEGSAFIAMELVTGTNLQELLAGGGRLPVAQVSDIARQAGDALDYAHRSQVVHRDVKPGNLVVTPEGQLKILDFGIARLATGDVTHPGRLMGTPNYMAPEQVTGGAVDGRADQFSLAVTLYHLLTGERPFNGESITAISYQVVNIMPPPPSRLNPSLPPDVDRVLARALSKDPAGRYPSCQEFAADLATALSTWSESAGRAMERTLVSEGGSRRAAVAGPQGARDLFERLGSPVALAGWALALVGLGLLAAAPYLLDSLSQTGHAAPGQVPRAGLRPVLETGSAPVTPTPAPDRAPRQPATVGTASGTIALELQHHFTNGAISVRVDGTEIVRTALTGEGSKTHWRRDIPVAAGRRRLEVRVTGDGVVDDLEGVDLTVGAHKRSSVSLSLNPLTHRLKIRPQDSGGGASR
ncbi:MAG TPA: serine/threonine-protein kinase [Patescibacteria group bacterium]|nr:serine/threonine-protein kinase [Patescibacteria group bacterium]